MEVQKIDEHNVIIPETKVVRDFDIISSRYWNNHEDKVQKEFNDFKNSSIDKLSKTRVINTLTMKYYNDEQDKQEQEYRRQEHIQKIAQKERN